MSFFSHRGPRMGNGERLVDRSARIAFAPLLNRVAEWQGRAARLHAESFHLHARQQPIDHLKEAARALAAEANQAMDEARQGFGSLADTSRYLDAEQGYQRLILTLERLVGEPLVQETRGRRPHNRATTARG
jgi:hypothetical protein